MGCDTIEINLVLHLELCIFYKLGLSCTKLRAVTIIVLMIVGMIVYDNHCASDCCSDCDNDCGNDCCNDYSSLGPPYFPSTSVGDIFHCGIFLSTQCHTCGSNVLVKTYFIQAYHG